MSQLPYQEILSRQQVPKGIDLRSGLEYNAPSPAAFRNSLRPDFLKRTSQTGVVSGYFKLDEAFVGAPFCLQVAFMHDFPFIHDDNFVAHLFDVAQQGRVGIGVRADSDVVSCSLLDGDGRRMTSGVVRMPELQPGAYYLVLRAQADAEPVRARPAVAGHP